MLNYYLIFNNTIQIDNIFYKFDNKLSLEDSIIV